MSTFLKSTYYCESLLITKLRMSVCEITPHKRSPFSLFVDFGEEDDDEVGSVINKELMRLSWKLGKKIIKNTKRIF